MPTAIINYNSFHNYRQKKYKNKEKLKEQFPIKKESAYILKIEGFSETTGTVSDTTKNIKIQNVCIC